MHGLSAVCKKLQGHVTRNVVRSRSLSTVSTSPAFITVAVTGDVVDKSRNNAVPLTPDEQIYDICKCYEAGARIAHCHTREYNPSTKQYEPTWKPSYTEKVLAGLDKHCPDMIFEASIANYGGDMNKRSQILHINNLETCSLAVGSVNFRDTRGGIENTKVIKEYVNTNEEISLYSRLMIENNIKPNVTIFDLSQISNTKLLIEKQLIELPVRFTFVFGGHMALPGDDKDLLEFVIKFTESQIGKDNFVWSTVGVGWNHEFVQKWTIENGGHPRTGFEDTLMTKRGAFAKSNAELITMVANWCKQYGRPIATSDQTRAMLHLNNRANQILDK